MDVLGGQSAAKFFGLDDAPVRYRHLALWPSEGRLTLHDRDVHLSGREFDLLCVMVAAAGHVLTRERLHAAVWGESRADGRKVDVNVCALRRRLAAVSPDWEYIHTHIGRGYRFEPRRRSR